MLGWGRPCEASAVVGWGGPCEASAGLGRARLVPCHVGLCKASAMPGHARASRVRRVPGRAVLGRAVRGECCAVSGAYATFDPKTLPSDKLLYAAYCKEVLTEASVRVLQGRAECQNEVVDALWVTERALIAHKDKHKSAFEVPCACCFFKTYRIPHAGLLAGDIECEICTRICTRTTNAEDAAVGESICTNRHKFSSCICPTTNTSASTCAGQHLHCAIWRGRCRHADWLG